jgi:2-amino-4-hydroxy-6-hydroxymethyldihydropteridine diphosphokinase
VTRAHSAVLGLGANLGDAAEALRAAVSMLDADPATDVVAASHIYRSAPIGGPDQPDYLNGVVLVETDRRAWELLALANEIESAHDRVREERWGPRTLDIDIITFDDVVSNDPDLTLPHPRADRRLFVILPWLEIAPLTEHPRFGSLALLAVELNEQDVTSTGDPLIAPPRAADGP